MDPSSIVAGYVTLLITSNASKCKCEKRYPMDISLGQLKEKLELVTGCDNRKMKIELFDENSKSLGFVSGDDSTLASLGFTNGLHLHLTDPTLADGAFDTLDEPADTYQMSMEAYAKRENSILAWKRRNKLGQFKEVDAEEDKRLEDERKRKEEEDKELAEALVVGTRCEVRIPGQATKRGVIRYTGQPKFKPGYWIGVQYDEPLGKNDGSVENVRYFECPPNYGAFVKPNYIEAGDFPEFGIDELDEI